MSNLGLGDPSKRGVVSLSIVLIGVSLHQEALTFTKQRHSESLCRNEYALER